MSNNLKLPKREPPMIVMKNKSFTDTVFEIVEKVLEKRKGC